MEFQIKFIFVLHFENFSLNSLKTKIDVPFDVYRLFESRCSCIFTTYFILCMRKFSIDSRGLVSLVVSTIFTFSFWLFVSSFKYPTVSDTVSLSDRVGNITSVEITGKPFTVNTEFERVLSQTLTLGGSILVIGFSRRGNHFLIKSFVKWKVGALNYPQLFSRADSSGPRHTLFQRDF